MSEEKQAKMFVIIWFVILASAFYWSFVALWNAGAQDAFAAMLVYLGRYWIQTVVWLAAIVFGVVRIWKH